MLSFCGRRVIVSSLKLALHRSITFWSGILVMAFIGWAWRDSAWRWSYACFGDHVVASQDSGVSISGEPGAHYRWSMYQSTIAPKGFGSASLRPRFGRPGIARHGWRERWGKDPFPAEWVRREGFDPILADFYRRAPLPGAWMSFVPYWLILLGVAIPWGALLAWRGSRMRKAALVSPP